jgi:hypothetical protein
MKSPEIENNNSLICPQLLFVSQATNMGFELSKGKLYFSFDRHSQQAVNDVFDKISSPLFEKSSSNADYEKDENNHDENWVIGTFIINTSHAKSLNTKEITELFAPFLLLD